MCCIKLLISNLNLSVKLQKIRLTIVVAGKEDNAHLLLFLYIEKNG